MLKNQILNFIWDQEDIRIDILVAKLANLSRKVAQDLILEKKVLINNNLVLKKNQIVKTGQKIRIFNDYKRPKPQLEPAEIDFEIIFQDQNMILINKPKNLVVHPGVGN